MRKIYINTERYYQKTVAEMSIVELISLRNRIYNQKRKNDNPRLDIQLHSINGELKDRGLITKHQALINLREQINNA